MKTLPLSIMVTCMAILIDPAVAGDVYRSLDLNELTFTDQPLPDMTERDEAVSALNGGGMREILLHRLDACV